MKKKLTMLMAGMLLSGGAAFAQTQVKGVVVSDEDGQPVIGATVRVVGTNVGAVTDMNGNFNITCPQGKTPSILLMWAWNLSRLVHVLICELC